MGIDFSAILEFPGFANLETDALSRLETDDAGSFENVCNVARSKDQYAHVIGPWSWQREECVESHVTTHEQRTRPNGINGDWSLATAAGFKLTFGPALFRVYHPLRWRIFLDDQQWQDVMLGAIDTFIEIFAAEKCVLSHDCSAVVTFLDEPNLEGAISEAVQQWRQFEATKLSEAIPHNDARDENNICPTGFWRFAGAKKGNRETS